MKQCFIYFCFMLSFEEELRAHDLKATPARVALLEYIKKAENAVPYNQLEQDLESVDRVTLYRNLNALNDVGLIHKIIDNNNQTYYSACAPGCNHGHVHDQHCHFTCEACGTTECFENIKIELPILPKGYQLKGFNSVANGICASCANS